MYSTSLNVSTRTKFWSSGTIPATRRKVPSFYPGSKGCRRHATICIQIIMMSVVLEFFSHSGILSLESVMYPKSESSLSLKFQVPRSGQIPTLSYIARLLMTSQTNDVTVRVKIRDTNRAGKLCDKNSAFGFRLYHR